MVLVRCNCIVCFIKKWAESSGVVIPGAFLMQKILVGGAHDKLKEGENYDLI